MSAPTLKEAYEAGRAAQRTIDKIERMLEEGTKQCPAEPTYEDWRDQFREKGEKPLTLAEAKDAVAKKHDWKDWKELTSRVLDIEIYMDEVCELIINKGG